MPNFKYPCFVRVKDAEQRKELIEWLEMVGYENAAIINNDDYWNIVATDLFPKQPLNWKKLANPKELTEIGYTDCGTNIELFKAIAAINDDNDYMQFFVSPFNEWKKCAVSRFYIDCQLSEDNRVLHSLWHKATLNELTGHFKTISNGHTRQRR